MKCHPIFQENTCILKYHQIFKLVVVLRFSKGYTFKGDDSWFCSLLKKNSLKGKNLLPFGANSFHLGLTLVAHLDAHSTGNPASVAQLDAPSDWRPGGRRFNPRRGRQHSFVEIDHEIFSTVILSLPLIQEGQLSVSGERMCTILVNRLED